MNYLVIIGTCGIFSAGCTLSSFNKDSSQKTEYRVNYAVGDQFKTLKPMFLVSSTDDSLWITPPGNMSPSLEQYRENNGKTQYDVKQLLSTGTRIRIVSIQETSSEGPIPFFKIDAHPTPVRGYFYNDKYEKSDKDSLLIDVHPDGEFYQKIN